MQRTAAFRKIDVRFLDRCDVCLQKAGKNCKEHATEIHTMGAVQLVINCWYTRLE